MSPAASSSLIVFCAELNASIIADESFAAFKASSSEDVNSSTFAPSSLEEPQLTVANESATIVARENNNFFIIVCCIFLFVNLSANIILFYKSKK